MNTIQKLFLASVSVIIYIGLIVVSFFISATLHEARAGDLHCNGNMVSVGDSIADLRASCPPPIYKETSVIEENTYNVNWHFTKNNKNNIHRTSDRVTKTVYSLSFYANPGEFIREVVVVEGTIVEINTLKVTNSKLN